ncbi:MAG: mannonate dehydratase, partial [Parahaliea sp.]
MQETWRWFGPSDPVTLRHIAQAGASGVVSSLHHIPTGEPWPLKEVQQRKQEIEAANLTWAAVESIPLHNDHNTRSGDYQRLLENDKASVCNVGQAG